MAANASSQWIEERLLPLHRARCADHASARFASGQLLVTMPIAAHPVNLLDELPVYTLDPRAAKRLYGCIGEVALYGRPFRTDPLA